MTEQFLNVNWHFLGHFELVQILHPISDNISMGTNKINVQDHDCPHPLSGN